MEFLGYPAFTERRMEAVLVFTFPPDICALDQFCCTNFAAVLACILERKFI